MTEIEFTYSIETAFGVTESQETVIVELEDDEVLEFEPDYLPPEATAWIPEFISANPGGRHQLPKHNRGQRATLPSNDPADIPAPTRPAKRGKQRKRKTRTGSNTDPVEMAPDDPASPDPPDPVPAEDDSGIDGPDSPLSDITSIGVTIPPAGVYEYLLTKRTIDPDDGKEGESAPSPPLAINVPAGYYVRLRPEDENRVHNPDGLARVPDGLGMPVGWVVPGAAGVTPVFNVPGVQGFDDLTDSTVDVEVVRTPLMDVSDHPILTSRVVVETLDHDSGDVDVILRQHLTNSTTTDTLLQTLSTEDEHDIQVVHGPSGEPGIDVAWNALAAQSQLVVRHVGSRSARGPRRVKTRVKHPGSVPGKGKHPRKRKPHIRHPHLPPALVPAPEPPAVPYPSGGYTAIVKEPLNKERAVLGAGYVPGNMIEYYGPNGTPVISTFFMGGIKLPTKPGEVRTISAHFYYAGVDQAATFFKVVGKNRDGVVVQDFGAFEGLSGITGNSSAQFGADVNGYVRRKITCAVPEDSTVAYLEIVPGGVGDGLFRVMGFQNEYGYSMTEFSVTHAPSGSLLNFFDMNLPGIPRGAFKEQDDVVRFVALGAEITHDPLGATSHTVYARSRNYAGIYSDNNVGNWFTDVSLVGINDVVEIRTVLNTSNLAKTPTLHSHFLDFERKTGGAGFGVFCRGDGTEFDGGATLFDFPPIAEEEPILEEEYADRTRGFGVMGSSTDWARGFGVEFYLNSAAEEFMSLIGKGKEEDGGENDALASAFAAYIFGECYSLRILKAQVVPVNREGHMQIDGLDSNGRWLLQATGIDAEVLGIETF